jgi:glycosyltransferase involved in cell wall biosynthesis
MLDTGAPAGANSGKERKCRRMPRLSIVIPVFKAERTLGMLYDQLVKCVPELCDAFEIIFVEDGGGDNSWAIIEKLASQDNRVRGIRLSRNYGQHNALLCGIRAARYEILLTMDDDLQHPASEIPKLLAALESGADVVYGVPVEGQHGVFRGLASRAIRTTLAVVMRVRAARNVSPFRAFRTRLRNGFSDYRSPTVSIDVLLGWTTSNFSAVKVSFSRRAAGTSNYSISRLFLQALDLITSFSVLPLRLASIIGFLFVMLGMGIFLYVIVGYMLHNAVVPGFTFLASIVTVFAGVQLFTLGIFGEYLARIHYRSMDRPPYLVTEQIGTASEPGITVAKSE